MTREGERSTDRSEARAIADTCYLLRHAEQEAGQLYVVLDATVGTSSLFHARPKEERLEIRVEGFGKAALHILMVGSGQEEMLRASVEQYRLARREHRRSQVAAWVNTPLGIDHVGMTLRRLLENEKRSGSKDPVRCLDSMSIPHWPHALSEQQRHMLSRSLPMIACLSLNADLSWISLPDVDKDSLQMHARGAMKQHSVSLVNEAAKVLQRIGVHDIDLERAHLFAESINANVRRRNILDRTILLAHDMLLDCDFHSSPTIRLLLDETPEHEMALAQKIGELGELELERIRDEMSGQQGAR